jgi:ActD protein
MSDVDPKNPHKPPVPERRAAGLLAEYETPAAAYHAAEKVRDAGYTKWDVHTPFPVHGMDHAMGLKPTPVGWISFAGGLTGGSLALLMQWWMNGHDYPLTIGGKPPFAVQAAVPVTFELTILLTAFATLFGMLGLNKLPQLYHWAFNSQRFERATDDRFFVSIEALDPKFDAARTRALLESTHPVSLEAIDEVFGAGGTALREGASVTFEALTGISAPFGKNEGDKTPPSQP